MGITVEIAESRHERAKVSRSSQGRQADRKRL